MTARGTGNRTCLNKTSKSMIQILRFTLVVFASTVVPALFSELFRGVVNDVPLRNSIVVAFFTSIVAYASVRKLARYPGERSWMSMQPVVLFWFGLAVLVIMLFRIPYSLVYLIASVFLTVLYVQFDNWYFDKRKKLVLAYAPFGRAKDAHRIPHANWIRMDGPRMPEGQIDAVVTDLHARDMTTDWHKFLAACTLQHIPVYNLRQVEESLTGRVRIRHMYENDLGSLLPSETYSIIKRVLESALVLAIMPLVLPIMAITAIAIMLESPGGAVFLQRRVGQFGREFTIYKFRSMCMDSEKDGAKLASAGDMRVTRIGKFIRKSRIDELPQFVNVLRGDMALIGPRPEQKAFVDQFEEVIPFYNYRHIVKPGITGWAQVVHGYTADADETQVKIEHDFYYIKNFSFGLDVLIVFKTIYTMLTGFGAR